MGSKSSKILEHSIKTVLEGLPGYMIVKYTKKFDKIIEEEFEAGDVTEEEKQLLLSKVNDYRQPLLQKAN